jgi:vacuolar protein sorting-associated protein 41
MAEGEGSKEPEVPGKLLTINGDPKDGTTRSHTDNEDDGEEDGEDGEEEEEEEPRLKYATVTKRLSSLFRNGDAVSAFLVSGDKMVCITDAGKLPCSD